MFQLTKDEFADLRSQFVISSWGGRRYPPYVFTEQDVAQAAMFLASDDASWITGKILTVDSGNIL